MVLVGEPGRAAADQERQEILGRVQSTLAGLLQTGRVKSAAACGTGGLAATLAGACLGWGRAEPAPPETARGLGVSLEPPAPAESTVAGEETFWFADAPACVVLTCAAEMAVCVVERVKLMGVPAARIGTVGGDAMRWRTSAGEGSVALAELGGKVRGEG